VRRLRKSAPPAGLPGVARGSAKETYEPVYPARKQFHRFRVSPRAIKAGPVHQVKRFWSHVQDGGAHRYPALL